MVSKKAQLAILGGLSIAGITAGVVLFMREKGNGIAGLPACTSSNVFSIAQSIVDGSFPGTVPQWYIDDGPNWLLQGLITITDFCDGYNDLVGRGIITGA